TPFAVGCRTQVVIEGEFTPGEGYTLQRGAGAAPIPRAYPDYTQENYGQLIPVTEPLAGGFLGAIDVNGGGFAWRHAWIQANNQPLMATATDLLFQAGVNEGVMRAFDATNGEIVWEFRTGSRFNQSPITYLHDGKQYLAIIASSAAANTAVAFDAAPDNQNRYRRSGSTLYVFALPDAVAAN
ncbi:MAG: PQQ-binding-like beta-propeller repeat protein, partial [Bauldia sp.]|nr:PQQ-binding-like beta-propeller repeat protein [Bauldia sp.]